MATEYLVIGTSRIPHHVINMRGDGSCLFYSISYIIYKSDRFSTEVRESIVQHVLIHWDRFQVLTSDRYGNNYHSREEYRKEMSRSETYGTTCELMAAGELFRYSFQVFRNGYLMAEFGQPVRGQGRLKFSGDLFGGHFDVYEEVFRVGGYVEYESSVSELDSRYGS